MSDGRAAEASGAAAVALSAPLMRAESPARGVVSQ
jgi:hypothetical protein